MKTRSIGMATLVASLAFGSVAKADDLTAGLQKGTPELKSVGSLAFGPDGLLFVADTQGAAIYAIATGDKTPAPAHHHLKVAKLDESIASALGTTPKEMKINDLAVNPASGNAYLSVARGTGPEALPAIVKVDGTGKIEVLTLKDLPFADLGYAMVDHHRALRQGTAPAGRRWLAILAPRSSMLSDALPTRLGEVTDARRPVSAPIPVPRTVRSE